MTSRLDHNNILGGNVDAGFKALDESPRVGNESSLLCERV